MPSHKSKQWSVYVLKDPRTGEISYVGVTNHLASRLRSHEAYCNLERNPLKKWLAELGAAGYLPLHEVVEAGDGNRCEAERRWIAHFRLQGLKLRNSTDGGLGARGYKMPLADRQKRGRASKGRKHSEETVQKMREAFQRRPPELLEAFIARNQARAGKPMSDEARANLSAARKGKPWSEKRRAVFEKNGHPGLGKKYSPEHCAAISAALKGKEKSAEARVNNAIGLREYWVNRAPEEKQRHLDALHQGRRESVEGKLKQSQSLKDHWRSKKGGAE